MARSGSTSQHLVAADRLNPVDDGLQGYVRVLSRPKSHPPETCRRPSRPRCCSHRLLCEGRSWFRTLARPNPSREPSWPRSFLCEWEAPWVHVTSAGAYVQVREQTQEYGVSVRTGIRRTCNVDHRMGWFLVGSVRSQEGQSSGNPSINITASASPSTPTGKDPKRQPEGNRSFQSALLAGRRGAECTVASVRSSVAGRRGAAAAQCTTRAPGSIRAGASAPSTDSAASGPGVAACADERSTASAAATAALTASAPLRSAAAAASSRATGSTVSATSPATTSAIAGASAVASASAAAGAPAAADGAPAGASVPAVQPAVPRSGASAGSTRSTYAAVSA